MESNMSNTLKFRALRPDEIDVRVQSVAKGGCILLLYKDARVDMALLDEVVGAMRWQREHILINDNLYCKVSIWDDTLAQWVSKCDVGTESNTEATKGEASDSFKRACFNWGIGRELYTSPFIWVTLAEEELYNGKLSSKVKFSVKTIDYTEQEGKRTISKLEIIDNKGVTRYTFGMKATAQAQVQGQKKAQVAQPTTPPQPSAPTSCNSPAIEDDMDLVVALDEIKRAQSVDGLKEVWERWKPTYALNNRFVHEVNVRKKELSSNIEKI